MKSDCIINTRIDRKTKVEAQAVLAEIGLSMSGAMRLVMHRIAKERAFPFAPLIPNDETIEAIEECRRGGLVQYNSVEELMQELNAED
jgi:DNA-damage-inducible protein J